MNTEWQRGKRFVRVFRIRKFWHINYQYTLVIIHFTLSLIHFSSAQTPTQQQLTGTWIGVHSESDIDFFCPLPTYLQLGADGMYHLGMVDNSARALVSTWAVQGDSVRLDTVHFAPRLVSIQGDLLRIGKLYPMVFRKFNAISIDSAVADAQLRGRVWQSDSLTISLFANGRVSLENKTTKQRTAHFWQLARFGQSVFLVILGNAYNRDGGYKPLWQISSLSGKQMQAIGWNGRTVATETFRFVRNLSPGDSCRPSGFQTCDNCFNRMWYSTNLSLPDQQYALKRFVEQHYQNTHMVGQSGLLSIKFVVNCTGERGLFQIVGVDEAYCPKEFDAQIRQQLLAICKDHISKELSVFATDQPGLIPHDSFISLTFKLKDGQLIDILP